MKWYTGSTKMPAGERIRAAALPSIFAIEEDWDFSDTEGALKVLRLREDNAHVAALVKAGCRRELLLGLLVWAVTAPSQEAAASTKDVKTAIHACTKLLQGLTGSEEGSVAIDSNEVGDDPNERIRTARPQTPLYQALTRTADVYRDNPRLHQWSDERSDPGDAIIALVRGLLWTRRNLQHYQTPRLREAKEPALTMVAYYVKHFAPKRMATLSKLLQLLGLADVNKDALDARVERLEKSNPRFCQKLRRKLAMHHSSEIPGTE
jgi:hypothetical protein